MKKFEYKTFNTKDLPETNAVDELNSLGNEGWQLVYVGKQIDQGEVWTMMREKEK